jgi:hypothetical protein
MLSRQHAHDNMPSVFFLLKNFINCSKMQICNSCQFSPNNWTQPVSYIFENDVKNYSKCGVFITKIHLSAQHLNFIQLLCAAGPYPLTFCPRICKRGTTGTKSPELVFTELISQILHWIYEIAIHNRVFILDCF